MTKLCPRGKAAAKRKFKVYPSAYANAYASKICAGKIKDPSGVKRKDFRGPKPTSASEGEFIKKPQPPLRNKKNIRRVLSPREIEYQKKKEAYDTLTGNENRRPRLKKMKVGMAVTAGAQSGMGRLQKSGLKLSKGGGADFETSATRIKPYGKTAAVKIEKLQPRKKVKSYPIGPPLSGDKGMQQPFSKYADKMYVKPKKKMMSGGFGIFGKKKKEEEKKSVQEQNANKKKKRLEELRKEIGAKKGKMMIMIAIGKPKKANKGLHAETKKKKKAIPGDPRERHEYMKKIQNPISEYDKKR